MLSNGAHTDAGRVRQHDVKLLDMTGSTLAELLPLARSELSDFHFTVAHVNEAD